MVKRNASQSFDVLCGILPLPRNRLDSIELVCSLYDERFLRRRGNGYEFSVPVVIDFNNFTFQCGYLYFSKIKDVFINT
jgi:hypothetical protein